MAIIAISRGTKSGGMAMAECLAEELGYPILGREIAQEAAADLGVDEEELIHRWETPPRMWEKFSSATRLYKAAVLSALADHAVEGNLVYHGLCGQLLLRGVPAVVRVRLIASLTTRIEIMRESDDMDEVTAERYLNNVDDARARWVRMMYGEDINDPALYDIVLNLDHVHFTVACGMLENTVRQTEFDLTDDVLDRLKDFQLECHVRVALAAEPDTRGYDFDIDATSGIVSVSGSAPALPSGRTGDTIHEIVQSVHGVKEVNFNINWFDPLP
ncbi:cytidylate kinase family protein [Candidatus Zixiibacteriota bacterium]